MNQRYLTLISRIEEEFNELDKIKYKVELGWKKVKETDDDLYLDSVALNLHDFYACLERSFKLIASEIDDNIPKGESWHQDLLNQMKIEIKSLRPPVIKKETANQLDEYRAFRHVVRNVYTFNLSKQRIEPLIKNLPHLHDKLKDDIDEFLKFLEKHSGI